PLGTPQPKPAPRHIQHRRTPHTAPGAASEISVASSRGAPNGPLSTQASYLSNPRPEYPDQAREMRQQGIVILDVEVGIDGRPDDVELSRGSGYSLLDRAALEAVRRWRFAPAEAAGLPIPTRVQVPVRFTLSQ
ncbi:MAG: energy transducer TonB, partial [Chthoniobacteraceae bacterium]